jgi:nucleoside-diphosphate kinase
MSYAYGDANQKAIPNLVHASGNSEEAELEVAHWFRPEELFEYDRVDKSFLY